MHLFFIQIRRSIIIFGKVDAFVYVIEFQKRGLSHAYILIILNHEYKITNADKYDQYVQAEIPNKEQKSRIKNQ